MSVGSIGTSVLENVHVQPVSAVAPASASGAAGGPEPGGDSSSVSKPAQLLGQLKELEAADPAKFKQVMSAISDDLSAAAEGASDPQSKAVLGDLASRFKTAGATGDLSALQPPAGGPPGVPASGGAPSGAHAPPPGGAGPSRKQHDPADLNFDGKVTTQERQAYQVRVARQAAMRGGAGGSNGPAPGLKEALSSVASLVGRAVDQAVGSASRS
jgi:hypothetical protein